MSKSSYSEKLRDPRWQKRRLEVMERDGWKCQLCGDSQSNLQVDHRWYTSGLEPWEYGDEALRTLCETCHGRRSALQKELRGIVSMLDGSGLEWLLGRAKVEALWCGSVERVTVLLGEGGYIQRCGMASMHAGLTADGVEAIAQGGLVLRSDFVDAIMGTLR